MIKHIQDYINNRIDNGDKPVDIANELQISQSMVTVYKRDFSYKASLDVAKRVFEVDGVVLHPFSKESLQYEINKGKKQ